jgi:hypothetical protein
MKIIDKESALFEIIENIFSIVGIPLINNELLKVLSRDVASDYIQ